MIGNTVWESLSVGGALAVGWSGLMLAIFARSIVFFLLGLLLLDAAVFEIYYLGFTMQYPWLWRDEWALQISAFFGHMFLALLAAFLLAAARATRISLPLRRLVRGLGWLEAALAVSSWVMPAAIVQAISNYSTPIFAAVMLAIGIRLLRRDTQAGKMMMLATLFSLCTAILHALERQDLLPAILYPDGLYGQGHNPIVSFIGLMINLSILMAWMAFVDHRQIEANRSLAEAKTQEAERLDHEVKKQTKALHSALAYAEKKNQEKTQILGYIGHDLRAPLSIIMGYLRLLNHEVPETHVKHLQAIERNANYQAALIDELLSYARHEYKPLALSFAWESTAEFLVDIAQQAEELCRQNGNVLILEIPDIIPATLRMDNLRMRQLMMNLLSNAAKFTRNGQVTLSIDCTGHIDDDWSFRFAVSDTGIGVPPEKRDSIFDAFEQLHEHKQGIGLGLYIAQAVVHALGGELELQSAENAGASFSFNVTLKAKDEQVVTRNQIIARISATNIQLPDKKKAGKAAGRHGYPEATDSSWGSHDFHQPMQYSAQEGAKDMQFPPLDQRNVLAMLAREGRVTDIELYLADITRQYPEYADFRDRIQDALDRLQLEVIERLSMAANP
uniref:sensor histidine kinase n=1 Tax=Castellaniella defragrans TaxID=75697 RepID=UPI003342A14B